MINKIEKIFILPNNTKLTTLNIHHLLAFVPSGTPIFTPFPVHSIDVLRTPL
jgi:hypothetical protein